MNRGFTLVELLAVIVLLGIIALIATPIVLNTIEVASEKSATQSAETYIRGLDSTIMSKRLNSSFTSTSCIITNNILTCSNDTIEYLPKGSKPVSGYVIIDNGSIKEYSLCINNYQITKATNKISTTKKTSCNVNTFAGTKVAAGQNDTHKGIVYMDPQDLSRTCTAQLAAANLNDEETPTPTGIKSGCMKFYVYNDDGANYSMILDHNTSGDVAWVTESDFLAAGGTQTDWVNGIRNTKGPITVNKRMKDDTEGWLGSPRLITADEIAHIVGADVVLGFDSTNNNSDWFYLDGTGTTYAEWQNDNNPIATSSNKSRYAWLYDNTCYCTEYGCNIEDNNAYPYDATNNDCILGYWTLSPVASEPDSDRAWFVDCEGDLDNFYVDDGSTRGVRPVITIPKYIIDGA